MMNTAGELKAESMYIHESLAYLEQVVVSLYVSIHLWMYANMSISI